MLLADRSQLRRLDIILFDAATAALDPKRSAKCWRVNRRHDLLSFSRTGWDSRAKSPITYISHAGLIVEGVPPVQFFASPRDPRTRAFLENIL